MEDFAKRAWACINLSALKSNTQYIQKKLGSTQMIATVKADGYGHGAIYAANAFAQAGAKWFSVSNINEAKELRLGGIKQEIIILGYTPVEAAPELLSLNIVQTVFSLSYARELSKAADGGTVRVHIKLDTGMNRLGVRCTDAQKALEILEKIYQLPGLQIEGVFSHFCHADSREDSAKEYTQGQLTKFMEVTEKMIHRGLSTGLRHIQNSAAVLTGVGAGLELARPGIILYGIGPSQEVEDDNLEPALSLRTVISMVKMVPGEECVGYGRTFKTPSAAQIATIPIGYADGYGRKLSNQAKVLIHGKIAPVVGNVCMDQTMVDVTGIHAKAGDEVVLIGKSGGQEITVQQVAGWMDAIPYEVICMISKRVPRVYVDDGNRVGIVQLV